MITPVTPRDQVCRTCGRRRLICEFYSYQKSGKTYIRHQCKDCINFANTARIMKNPEKEKARHKAYYAARPGKKAAIERAWYARNKDKKRAYARRRRLEKALKKLELT